MLPQPPACPQTPRQQAKQACLQHCSEGWGSSLSCPDPGVPLCPQGLLVTMLHVETTWRLATFQVCSSEAEAKTMWLLISKEVLGNCCTLSNTIKKVNIKKSWPLESFSPSCEGKVLQNSLVANLYRKAKSQKLWNNTSYFFWSKTIWHFSITHKSPIVKNCLYWNCFEITQD